MNGTNVNSGRDHEQQRKESLVSNPIKKIELELGTKKFTLTMQQARDLKAALDELFGEKVVTIPGVPYPYPYPIPVRPWGWDYPRRRYIWSDSSHLQGGVTYKAQTNVLSMKIE